MTQTPWQQYTDLLRRLDAVRAVESTRTEATRQQFSMMSAQDAHLESALAEQGSQLVELARRLGLPAPNLTPDTKPPATVTHAPGQPPSTPSSSTSPSEDDPARALARSAAAAQHAAEQAQAAENRGRQAALLPNWPPGPRNLVIYLGAATVGLVFQILAVLAGGNNTPYLAVLFVIPAGSFAAGLVTVSTLGKIPIPPEVPLHYGQPQSPPPQPRSARLGFVICFGAGPAFFVVYLVLALVL